MKKKTVIILSISVMLVLLLATSVFARENVFQRSLDSILDIFSLDFLNNDAAKLGAFIRAIIGITVFTIIFGAVRRMGAGSTGGAMFNKGGAIMLALTFSALTVMFLPVDFLIELGEAYSAIGALVLVGILGIALWYLFYRVVPSMGLTGRALHVARIIFLFLLLGLLDMVTGYVSDNFQMVIPIIPFVLPNTKSNKGAWLK